MTTASALTVRIEALNLMQRFNFFVARQARTGPDVPSGVIWGTDNRPFTEFTAANMTGTNGDGSGQEPFAGTVAQAGVDVPDGVIPTLLSGVVSAQSLYQTIIDNTVLYTSIRRLRARLNVTGNGGNNGTRPTAGIIFDQTKIAFLRRNGYTQNSSINSLDANDLQTGNPITRAGIQGGTVPVGIGSTFDGQTLDGVLRDAATLLNTVQTNAISITVNVCHASCHANCHASRIRR